MISDSYLLLCIEELLSWLKVIQYFLHLDLRDEYFYFHIAKDNIYKTFFSCRYGTFEHLVILFGLMNAPSILEGDELSSF